MRCPRSAWSRSPVIGGRLAARADQTPPHRRPLRSVSASAPPPPLRPRRPPPAPPRKSHSILLLTDTARKTNRPPAAPALSSSSPSPYPSLSLSLPLLTSLPLLPSPSLSFPLPIPPSPYLPPSPSLSLPSSLSPYHSLSLSPSLSLPILPLPISLPLSYLSLSSHLLSPSLPPFPSDFQTSDFQNDGLLNPKVKKSFGGKVHKIKNVNNKKTEYLSYSYWSSIGNHSTELKLCISSLSQKIGLFSLQDRAIS